MSALFFIACDTSRIFHEFTGAPSKILDKPTFISTSRIEDLALELKKKYTILMVSHNSKPEQVPLDSVYDLFGKQLRTAEGRGLRGFFAGRNDLL